MCLYCFSGERVAEYDIPVKKVLIRKRGKFGKLEYYTPFRRERVSMRYVERHKRFEASGDEDVKETYGVMYCVGGGFIHTINDRFSMEAWLFPSLEEGEEYVVFSCVIPKGVRYWCSSGQYASKSIRFVSEGSV